MSFSDEAVVWLVDVVDDAAVVAWFERMLSNPTVDIR
jgi:hypothetical protein